MAKLMFEIRGLRNNNPGNIEKGQNFDSEVSSLIGTPPEERFAQFSCMDFGIRAIYRILKTYRQKHGIDTIEGIIHRWAPPIENDTDSYINSAVHNTLKNKDIVLAKDNSDYPILCKSIISHENGYCPFTLEYLITVFKWAVPKWD